MRLEEARSERRRKALSLLSLASFGLLALSLIYASFQALIIEDTVRVEKAHLNRLMEEFSKYRKSQLTVDKTDLESLDQLRRSRILWSEKIASMRSLMPAGNSLNKIIYTTQGGLTITASMPSSGDTDPLLTAYEYGQNLAKDSVFALHFSRLRLLKVQDKGANTEYELTTAQPGARP
jgi:hypothetical protein